ncbi:Phosphoinositide 3-kinase regulatory subunit 5 [Larimichthys crocea]|uniref:Phosphoinositide 3-kinase regulatory subunit 5 n=1 Tax=Larimichthys crocea TaxID=215358 RepID=A0A6G0HUY0_LARCR|nr:Phosphoinositide 3-kinase regulatory subunit 5 [Larimichthys crocea]
MEQSSCTEDRIQHVLERCLCDLGLNTPDKQLWNAGLCINRWCLEELVKRDGHNFLILLQKVLKKTKEVLEQCRYELVVPLTLLFSSTLLKAPPVSPDCGVLQEAYLLFHSFLAWPEPCCSASKRLLNIIQQELRAPGISFQRLVRAEQSVSPQIHHSKTIMVLLVSPDDDVPPEVQSVAEQLSSTEHSNRDVTITLILHGFQAALGARDLQALHTALQTKRHDELEQLMKVVTDSMETAASAADLSTARQGLIHSMERLRESLAAPAPANGSDTGAVETFMLPFPNCRTCSWENDNFDFLNHILDSDLDSPEECFLKGEIEEEDINDTSVDEEDEVEGSKPDRDFQNHRISTASSSSRDSTFSSYSLSSSWSVSTPSGSSGIESDFSEDMTHEDTEEGQDSQPKPRKKPKKKSRSILGVERFSLLFKNPRSPSVCRRVQSMGHRADFTKDYHKNGSQLKHSLCRQIHPLRGTTAALDPLSPQKHMCVRRRPILSCDEGDVAEVPTLVKVVVFGGDKEAGRLARAYSDLQQKESKCPRLTRMCKLQFYFVPTKRRTTGSPGQTPTEGQIGGSNKAAASESNDSVLEENTTDIAQMLGMLDPWYERNVLNMLSLSSDVLCQTACKDGDVSVSRGNVESLPLLADLVLYYCRHADQPVLVQLYQAELTLAGGERRREVFIHSLELGHSAGTRAVKAMGAASKRFGIDKEREAVPLTLSVAYNKVAVSGRSQWMQTEIVCTSINLYKACRKPEQLDSRVESLRLMMTEVLKRQCSKSKKGYNQHISISEVKVDKVQVSSGEDGTTFAVCLDQDEKKFIQSVTRCEVSLCCKPGSSSDWKSYKPLPGQVQPLHPSYCSLLCLPITSFTASSYSKLWINAENMDDHPALSAYNDVQAILKEMNSQSASQKGRLRWILQKKLESDPSCSILLIQVLVKELKKKLKTTCKTQSYVHVIPVLHTIYYVVIQSGGMIPASLYQTVYECLIKLLILPTPYCTVVLSTLRSIKMEMITPGSLYQRRVVAEQNLKSEHLTVQEKVFVLADPAVFSAPLEATVRAHFEAPSSFRNTTTMEKNVVLHVLHTGLGATCQSSRLAQALKALEDHVVEKYFQEVVLTVEQSIKHGPGGYLNKLHDIYRNILTDCREEITKVDHGSLVYGATLPFPEINFQLWRSEEDLWNLLVKFALDCCRNSSTDEEVKDKKGLVQSEDDQKERNPTSVFNRRKAFKNMKPADKITLMREKIEAFPGSSPAFKEDRRRHTARVVLSISVFHIFPNRERESKRLVLTKRLDIQFYYIPVTDVEPSSIPPVSYTQNTD